MSPSTSLHAAAPPDALQTVYLNGEYLPLAQARIPVLDRGFIFGDGIYEVVPVYEGRPFRWQQHLSRLRRSLDKVRIASPHDEAGWTDIVQQLVARHPWPLQFIYLHITRGVARRDHAMPANAVPTVFGMSSELRLPSDEALQNGVAAITLEDERWLHCDIKSISLLGNVLARQAAADAGALECLQFRNGCLTEGSSSNVWLVQDGTLVAPPRDNLILEGIRYGLMQELAEAQGIAFEVRHATRSDVAGAQEILLTSATKEVLAVTTLDSRPVGNGRPGPVFERLHAAYRQAVANLAHDPH